MRKKLYQTGILSLMLIFANILMSCTTTMGVYSSALQTAEQDQLCNLRIHYEMGITGFNGKPVSWGNARDGKFTEIAIPAGQNAFRFDYYYNSDEIQQQAVNFTFTYDFVPGHDYELRAAMGGRTIVVTVTDKTNRSLSKTIPMRG